MTEVNRCAVIGNMNTSESSELVAFYCMDENPSAIPSEFITFPPDDQRAPILKSDGRLHISLLPLSVQALVGAPGVPGPQGPQGIPGTNGAPGDATVKTVDASATSIATTSLADVAGMSFAMEANSTYRFEAELLVNATGLAGTIGVATAYSGTSSAIFSNTTLAGSVTGLSSLLTAVVGSVLLNSVNPVRVAGRIRTTTAGTFSFQAQRSAGITATLAGGCAQFSKV